MAKSAIPETNQRNVFIEGPISKYELAKQMIDQMIDDYLRGGPREPLPDTQHTTQSLAFQYQQ